MNRVYPIVVLLVSWAVVQPVSADALKLINDLRLHACAKPSKLHIALQSNDKLSVAAKHLANDVELREALQRAGYRADQSAVIRIAGTITDESLQRVLAKSYCDTLSDSSLTEVGIHQTKSAIALLFAAPFAPPATADATKIAAEVLRLVNEARAQARRCGRQKYGAVKALSRNPYLDRAAKAHAQDMAQRDHASHQGSDGSAPGDRVTRTGYKWANVAENVAAGHQSAAEVVAGWLASPGHCANIMGSNYVEMGVAYAVNPKARIGIYWAQVFGRPLEP